MAISVVVLLGPPGSGKGTQAKEIQKKHVGWIHISTGDLFRAEISSGSELGKSVKGILDAGKLVSDSVTDKVFQSQVQKIVSERSPKGLLLDGYPRTQAQAESLIDFVRSSGLQLLSPIVIEFHIDSEELVTRLSDRLINPRTGKIYHRLTNPPKVSGVCDDDGAELVQRPDDKPETIRERIKLYESQRDAILRGMGNIATNNGVTSLEAAQSPERVNAELVKAIGESLQS